jgi:hypothetical protein
VMSLACLLPRDDMLNRKSGCSSGFMLRMCAEYDALLDRERALLSLIHTCHAASMPCRVNSHMPCRAPAILRQCRVLRESSRGSRKYPNC